MKIAVVVQRYGAEILGGAETHAALMAGILNRHHEVEVLTTTADDYHRWSEGYEPGRCEVDGVSVRRFPVVRGRSEWNGAIDRLMFDGFESADFGGLDDEVRAAYARRVRRWPDALQEAFIRGQGPIAPGIQEHLRANPPDQALFVTYLYPTTYDGIPCVPPGRACVVPTLHDEAPAYLPVFGRRLAQARILCSTRAEIDLFARLYPDDPPTAERMGYGIPLPGPEEVGRREADERFFLYAGRIDVNKGVGELLRWYEAAHEVSKSAPGLKLIGQKLMDLPDLPGLEVLGFVSEEEKARLMREAIALVHPSPYESLGIVLLEALSRGTPIVVNAQSEVMVEHCRESDAGVWVRDPAEFAAAAGRLAGDLPLRDELGRRGREYVEAEYSLEAYERRLLEVFPVR